MSESNGQHRGRPDSEIPDPLIDFPTAGETLVPADVVAGADDEPAADQGAGAPRTLHRPGPGRPAPPSRWRSRSTSGPR